LVPVTVNVVAADPATTVFGLNDVIAGPLKVKVDAPEAIAPGFCTVMLRLPAVPSKLAGTVAVIDVAVPAVTVSAVLPA